MKKKCLATIFAVTSITLLSLTNMAYAEEETAPANAPAPVSAPAEENHDLKMFRFALRMEKLDFVKKAMHLSGEEEKKFLEQYDHYDIESKALNDERLAIIKDYAAKFDNMTDKEADNLVKRSLDFRKQRTALLEKYYGKIAKVTSKVIAARFLQVESYLNGVSDVTVGGSLPLMEK